ncbi:MAG: LysR family transcriptional regulator [Clostridia bacterium]|nr:LysR family transcriptional regulator [Clostridia bacterium]
MFQQAVRSFLAVVENGSFNRAAEALYLTPPAVKKQMDQLEKEIGFPLLQRTNHGVVTTLAGQSLYQDLLFLTGYIDHAVDRARQIATGDLCTIRIGTSLLSPCMPLLEFWNRIGGQYPQFRLSIVPFSDDADSMSRVFRTIGKEFDLLIRVCDVTNWKDYFRFLPVRDSHFCIYAPKTHPLARKGRLQLADLYGEKVVLIRGGTSALTDEMGRFLRTEHPRIHLETIVPHYDISLFNRCAEENLLLIAPDAWHDIHPSLEAVPVDWDYTIPFGITYPLNPPKEVELFIEVIRQHLESRRETEKRDHEGERPASVV